MIVYSALYDENVLHFIGHWQMATEGVRLRDDLMAFRRLQEESQDPGDILALPSNPHQYHAIRDYVPGVQYHPNQWDPTGWSPFHMPSIRPWFQDLEEVRSLLAIRPDMNWPSPHLHWHHPQHVPAMDAPGQVIYLVNQAIYLLDNDILNLTGGPEPVLDPALMHRLHQLAASAEAIDVLDALKMPQSPGDLGTIVTTAHDILSALSEDSPHVVVQGTTLTGSYVNGVEVDEPLVLDDLLPAPFLPDAAEASEPVSHIIETLHDGVEGELALQAGANMAMNSAIISSVGLLGGVIAVAGNVYRIDAIIQSNAYSDTDHIGDQFVPTGQSATAAYNYASFSHVPMTYAAPETSIEEGGFPDNWIVSIVDGDLIFSQWLVQTNFIHDNDIHVLCDTGAYSNFVTGANLAHNINSFSDLGLVYDLILIGGNLYDANIISQLNVLLDDDYVYGGAAGREGTSSDTSGNLLYNGATISNMGAQNWLEGLPEHYLEALERLAAGDRTMPEGFGDDEAFAGFGGLSVLVVTGNVYDLHYISQTNILGDADLVAAAEAAALDDAAATGADWHLSTGENALINTAAILDTDSLGDVAYAGGTVYSDTILIQAEILSGPSDDDPDALVYEAIAFITADDGTDVVVTSEGIVPTPAGGNAADVMDSVLT